MWLGRFSVRNSVLINVVMVAILAVGAYSFLAIPRELMPEITFNWAFVQVSYPGASPEEVEQLITEPLEDAIDDVDKIDMVTSGSSEGASFISVKFEQNLSDDEFDKRYQDLRTAIDSTPLPDGAEDPVFIKLDTQTWNPVISVIVSGDLPETRLKEIAEDLDDRIMQIKGVARIIDAGIREREVWVEIDPDKLDRLGVTLPEVVQALRAKNVNIPGGTVTGGRSEYILRTLGQFGALGEISEVVVRSYDSGHQVRIRDVATIRDTWQEAMILSRLNGLPSMTLNITKKSGESTIRIVRDVKKLVDEYRVASLPSGAHLDIVNDSSITIDNNMEKLQSNAVFGIVFVALALWMFVGWRSALVVIVGMPVTFALSLTFMYITGRSLNSNSLFGLVLVLGMVVDHAIVMVENVYRHIQMGKKPSTAVVDGIQEVFGPVLVATLTTIAAFLPLMLMPGIVGSFLKVIPLVVTLALVASVFEAFVILPSHAAEWLGHGETVHKTSRWMRALRERYVDALAWVIRRRYAVIVGFVALLISSGFLIPLIGLNMWSSEALPTFRVYVWMPPGTDLAETDRVMRQLEKLAMTLPKDEFNAAVTMTGYLEEEGNSERKTNVGQIIVDLAQNKDRDRTVDEIINDLRLRAAAVTGYDRLVFRKMEDGPPTGKAVEVKVKGKRFDELTTIADEMKADLAATPGVYDITDDFNLGKEEIRIIPDGDRARLHGLEVAQVAGLVRTAVNGEVATTYRDGDEDIDVIVKFADAKSYTAERIESMKVLTPSGALIPLKEVAHMQITRGYSDIPRFEGERAITVSANVDESVNSAVAVNQRVQERFKEISQRYPGYSLDFRGQFQEFNDAFSSLAKLFVLGNFLIFILLVAQFKSITQPFIIMFTVPFAFFGAMIGLLVVRAPFSVNTLYGIVALAGIVVNDSIVLVDFINQRRKAGASKWRAIMQGGRLRMRPIMLTTLTTIAGLAPMALGLGGRSETWMPLATTIVWGLATATFLTLFIIPSLYAIVDDMAFFRRRRERVEARDRDTAKQPVPARGLAPEPAD